MNTAPDPTLLNISLALKAEKRIRWSSDFSRKVERLTTNYFRLPINSFVFQIAEKEYQAMARFQQSTFASLTLNNDQAAAFEKWCKSSNLHPMEAVNHFLGLGFKISCSWVAEQNAFCFSVIGTEQTKAHRNMVMTSWSDDLEEVILIAHYKHFEVCGGDSWPSQQNGQRWG